MRQIYPPECAYCGRPVTYADPLQIASGEYAHDECIEVRARSLLQAIAPERYRPSATPLAEREG